MRFRAYLQARHALLAVIFLRNEAHIPAGTWYNPKATWETDRTGLGSLEYNLLLVLDAPPNTQSEQDHPGH